MRALMFLYLLCARFAMPPPLPSERLNIFASQVLQVFHELLRNFHSPVLAQIVVTLLLPCGGCCFGNCFGSLSFRIMRKRRYGSYRLFNALGVNA